MSAKKTTPSAIKGVHPALTEALEASLHAEKIRLIMKLRRSGITDTKVLSAIEQVPRERFVEEQFRDRAYEDNALPIAMDQTISQPTVVAEMTQMLNVEPTHTVLEIGTGSGYQTAILSKLARRVHTIERHKPLADLAKTRFDSMKLRNITPHVGDGSKGWPHGAPYERILVTAAAEKVPQELLTQLAIGGIMIIPVGPHVADQHLLKLTRISEEEVASQVLTAVRFVPLIEEK
jgi:protein-L-isoaspartate(D-aspartate) O-methyltransferase